MSSFKNILIKCLTVPAKTKTTARRVKNFRSAKEKDAWGWWRLRNTAKRF